VYFKIKKYTRNFSLNPFWLYWNTTWRN